MKRKAKIGATLGPACDSAATLGAMLRAGLDVARLNFSHGTIEEHRARVERLRAAARKAGRAPAVLADLQGPRLRIGALPDGGVELRPGEAVTLVAGRKQSAAGTLPVDSVLLSRVVQKGHRVLIDDGTKALRVLSTRGERVRCEVERGGTVTPRKGINLPDSELPVAALTTKDRRDLQSAVDLDADWLAVSFVRRARDVVSARRLLKRAGSAMPVMSKIERPEAVDHLDEILAESDGILVARGDLGVEVSPEQVPLLQKTIVEAANAAGKPVVTATQMLESMRESSRPTRAEASDVANAVLDGSSALLLTAETAAGRYPVESVAMMARIIEQVEASGRRARRIRPTGKLAVPEATAFAACRAAHDTGARRVVAFTESGFTALQLARFRPRTPILAFSPDEHTRRRLSVVWGVEPREVPRLGTVDELMDALDKALLEARLARKGELVVVVCGAPVGVSGSTNLMKIHQVGTGRGA